MVVCIILSYFSTSKTYAYNQQDVVCLRLKVFEKLKELEKNDTLTEYKNKKISKAKEVYINRINKIIKKKNRTGINVDSTNIEKFHCINDEFSMHKMNLGIIKTIKINKIYERYKENHSQELEILLCQYYSGELVTKKKYNFFECMLPIFLALCSFFALIFSVVYPNGNDSDSVLTYIRTFATLTGLGLLDGFLHGSNEATDKKEEYKKILIELGNYSKK